MSDGNVQLMLFYWTHAFFMISYNDSGIDLDYGFNIVEV